MTVDTLRSNVRAIGQLAAGLSPWVPTRGPSRSDQVTTAWLTEHIGSQVPDAVARTVTPLDGTTGTTDRRNLRVEWDDAGAEGGLPQRIFVKSTPLSAKNRLMVAPLDMAVNEVRFYHQAADGLGDHAPTCWYGHAGIGARHLLVLEDIVARGCHPYSLHETCTVEHAEGLMDAFAALHAAYWNSPRLVRDLDWVRPWSRRPGYSVLRMFYRRGRAGAMKLDRPEATQAVRRLVGALDDHADDYYRRFEAGPLTLLHGDSHLGNTYAMPDGRAGLLDWQVVWRGPGLRELAYFMTGGLEPEVRRAEERSLIERYLEGLRSHGVSDVPTVDAAFDDYRAFIGEAWDASAMTIAWPGLQAEANMEASWRRACIAVEDHDVATAVERAARGVAR